MQGVIYYKIQVDGWKFAEYSNGALLYSPIGSIARPAELHSPSAERNCLTENVTARWLHPLAPLRRLSHVDLLAANDFDKPFAASEFDNEKLEVVR